MARKWLNSIDLNKNEIQNARVQNLGSAPSSPVEGQIYYDTTAHKLYWYNGSAWIDSTGVALVVPAIVLGSSAAAGSAATGIRSDATIAAFDATAPTTSAVGDAAAVGSVAFAARRDHTHGREAFGSVTAETTFGTSSSDGSGTTHVHANHQHGNPAHGAAAHSAIKLSDLAAAAADLDIGTHKLINVVDPSGAQDAATKNYVDTTAQGLDAKASVRVATTAAGTLASSFENADVIDGITLATGDRILIKNQAAGAENGIYTVNASGAPTRALDADAWAEFPSAYVWVEVGTVNADSGWVCTNDAGGTLGSTAITWTQFSGAGMITAGAGLTKTGNTIDAVAASGSGIVVNPDNIDIDPTNGLPTNRGGTGSITVAGAKANLGFMTRYAASFGDGAAVSYNIDHNLGTLDVIVQVFENSGGAQIECDVTHSTTNRVILAFTIAPASNALRVVVIG